MLAAVVVASFTFSPNTIVGRPSLAPRATSPVCVQAGASRRAALFGASAALIGGVSNVAHADDSAGDDAIARIAAKNAKALQEERAATQRRIEKSAGKADRQNAGSNVLIGVIAFGSVAASLPFFYKNVVRLFVRYVNTQADGALTEAELKQKYKYDERMNPELKKKNLQRQGRLFRR